MSRSAVLLEWLRKTVADRGLAVGSLVLLLVLLGVIF